MQSIFVMAQILSVGLFVPKPRCGELEEQALPSLYWGSRHPSSFGHLLVGELIGGPRLGTDDAPDVGALLRIRLGLDVKCCGCSD